MGEIGRPLAILKSIVPGRNRVPVSDQRVCAQPDRLQADTQQRHRNQRHDEWRAPPRQRIDLRKIAGIVRRHQKELITHMQAYSRQYQHVAGRVRHRL